MAVTVTVEHTVADYDTWLPVFDEHGATRTRYGCTSERIYRGAAEPNDVCVVMSWPSIEGAQAFIADPSLQEAMQRGGVTAPPTVSIADAG